MKRFIDTTADALRHRARPEGDRGFTLIELLVVVIVIGVLAAIAIPVYIGVQNGARDASVRSDLVNAKQAVSVHLLNGGGQYVPMSSLAADGYTVPATGYTAPADKPNYKGSTTPASGAAAFCIQATSPTSATFYATEADGVKAGTCP